MLYGRAQAKFVGRELSVLHVHDEADDVEHKHHNREN